MTSDKTIDEELRRDGENPRYLFILGDEDGVICTFTAAGTIQSFFMSDEKAKRLKEYLKAHNRIFKTMADAHEAFRWIKNDT
jgi:hypothetical protein